MKHQACEMNEAGVFVLWVFSCLSLTIITLIGVRFLNSWIALTATIFAAFSSIELGIVRRAWQDTTIEFLSLLLIYVTCEIAAKRRRYCGMSVFSYWSFATTDKTIWNHCVCFICGILSWTLARERAWSSLVWFVTGRCFDINCGCGCGLSLPAISRTRCTRSIALSPRRTSRQIYCFSNVGSLASLPGCVVRAKSVHLRNRSLWGIDLH